MRKAKAKAKASRSRGGKQDYIEWEVPAMASQPFVEVGETVLIRGEKRRVDSIESVRLRYWKVKAGGVRRRWRANITTSALALAALLSGCVEEGELEPDWGAAVDALVEEVGGGLWAGENPLADEDDDYFTCYGSDQCDTECRLRMLKDENATSCVCAGPMGNRPPWYTCKVGGLNRGEDGGGDGLPEPVDPPGPPDDGRPKGPGGRKGEPTTEEEEEEEKVRETKLVCDAGVTRGRTAGCEVETKLETDIIEFHWTAKGESGRNTRSGDGYLSWEGTATEDRYFTVNFNVGHYLVWLDGAVTVEPRGWSLPERSSDVEYTGFNDRKQWGAYEGADPSPETLEGTAAGTGPWAGTWILKEQPTITDAALYVSFDLESGSALGRYKLVFKTCGLPRGDSIGVYDLNVVDHEDCDNKGNIDAWKTTVIEHERGHEASLNKCVKAANDGRMAAIEAIVRTDEEAVKKRAKKLWTDDLVGKLLDASKSDLEGAESPVIWERRSLGQWKKHTVEFEGHDGTDGCDVDPVVEQ